MINSIIEVRFIFNGSPLVAGEKNPSSGHQSLLWWPPDNIVVFIVKDVHSSLQFVLLVVILNISFM